MGVDRRARFVFGVDAGDEPATGVTWRQLPVVVAAVAAAVAALAALPPGRGVLAATAVAAVGVAAAFVPVGGHRLDVWAPLWLAWTRQRLTRVFPWWSTAPTQGHQAGWVPADPPPGMDGVELFAVEVDDGGHVGVAWDEAAGVCGAVLRVRSEGVALDDDATRDQRLAAWGGVLAAVARDGSPVHRLQWMQRTVAADGAAAAAWFEARAVEGAAAESYRRLLAAATPGDRRHDSVVSVSVSADRAGVHGRGRAVVRDRLVAVLLDEVGLLAGQLTGAGFTVDGAATPAGLIGLLRRGFDPFSAVSTAVSNDAAVVWPVASEATWRSYRTDGAWHATYWIEQWPRSPVAGDFLAPLTMGVLEAGSVSVIAEPVAAARAHRQVQRDLVSSATNDALRTRAGFRITARRMHRNAAVARREQELAVGHAEYRVVGLLTVSARHPDELESACGRLEQAAQQAHLGVRRLWGRQPAAFAAAQPLALGLR